MKKKIKDQINWNVDYLCEGLGLATLLSQSNVKWGVDNVIAMQQNRILFNGIPP